MIENIKPKVGLIYFVPSPSCFFMLIKKIFVIRVKILLQLDVSFLNVHSGLKFNIVDGVQTRPQKAPKLSKLFLLNFSFLFQKTDDFWLNTDK